MVFKIGYDVPVDTVHKMFDSAEHRLEDDCGIRVAEGNKFEIGLLDTGDHALEWAVYYYTKDIKNLLKNRQTIRECILKTAIEFNISLATPITHKSVTN